MKSILCFFVAVIGLAPILALAQSTATPVVTGYLTTSGCSSGQTSCFVQFGAGGGGNAAAGPTGSAVPTSANYLGFSIAGVLTGISAANPLPVSGSFSLTNPTVGSAVPSTANYIAGNKAGTLTGLLLDSNGYLQTSLAALPAFSATPTFNCGTGCYQTTQPVSGTVAATQSGTWTSTVTLAAGSASSGAYVSGALASGAVVDLTNVQTTAGGTAPSKALSVQGISGGTAVPVSGTVAATQSGTWTNTVTQPTAANLNATVVGAGTAGSPSGGVLSIQSPNSGTPTQTSVSCGTSSTTFLAASTATQFITIKIPAGAANAVWFNFAGAAAVTAAPSEDLAIGASQTWSALTGFLPTSAITCIAAVATTVTLIYK